MNHKIKPMTESGVLSAITAIMALIGLYVPILGTVAVLVWPLPIVILIVRHGLRWGLMAIAVAGALMAILIEPLMALHMVVAFAPVGVALGIGYRRGFGATKMLVAAIGVSIVAEAAVILLALLITSINPLTAQIDLMKESFTSSIDMYRAFNMPEDQIAEAEKNFSSMMQVLPLLIPLFIVLMGMLDAFVNYWVAGKVLRRLGHQDFPVLKPLSEWRLPVFFLYLYAFGLVGMYWGGTRQIDLLYQISFNANLLASFFGFLQGLALLQTVANHWKVSKFVRWVIVIFVMFNGMLLQILSFTGLFDMVFDYRRRFSQKK